MFRYTFIFREFAVRVCCVNIIVIAILTGHCAGLREATRECKINTKTDCQQLSSNTCFGVRLPYAEASSYLVNSNYSEQMIQNELKRWESLQNIPRCWSVVQPLICSYFMPRCSNGTIDLPSQELCKISRSPCRVVEETLKEWPPFLRCEDFPSNCENVDIIRELKFNNSAKCLEPMIAVDQDSDYYEGFEGCAFECKNPYFTDEEHECVSTIMKYLSALTFLATGSVVVTFLMDWKSSKVYPSVIVFYVNLSYFIANLGWTIQFLPNTKEDIVCRKDLTVRKNEPGGSENLFCSFVFFLIYFGAMSALAWLVVFAYVWDITCNSVGRIRERIDKQKIYFVVISYLIPLVLSIVSISAGKVDGNTLTGICFIGYFDSNFRIALVFIPVVLAVSIMLFYFWKGTYRLLRVTLSSSDFISPQGKEEIKSNAVRVIIFAVFAFVLLISSLVLQINEITLQNSWETSLRRSVLCRLHLKESENCELLHRPNVIQTGSAIAIFYLGGILVSSWAWTKATLRTWKRFFRRLCKSDENESSQHHMAVTKHKLISKAFSKRNQMSNKRRLSLSLYSTHEDPVGLNKLLDPTRLCHPNESDLEHSQQLNTNTEGHEEISSEWAAGLPRLITRRGGIVPPSSNSVSYISEDSRRQSCDSALSEAAARTLQSYSSDRIRSKNRRDWFRMSRKNRHHKWGYPWRRGTNGSSSSLESNQGSQILPAITALIDKRISKEQQSTKKHLLVKEVGVQTSLEKLYVEPAKSSMIDKSMQSSLVSLREAGTQTKKSATKKKDKEKLKGTEEEENNQPAHSPIEDPVVKLLTPN